MNSLAMTFGREMCKPGLLGSIAAPPCKMDCTSTEPFSSAHSREQLWPGSGVARPDNAGGTDGTGLLLLPG